MTKKSFKEMVSSLEEENYGFNYFNVETIGDYFPEDADWNYKDIIHPKLIHSGFSALQAFASNDIACGINLQKIPFLGFSIPLLIINYEYSKFNQTYFTSFGPYIILVNTIIEKHDTDKTRVRTLYAIGSKGIFKILHKTIGKVLLKNYKKLMSEDIPMRNRKGELRKFSHKFYSPSITYPFNFSEKINRSNIYLDKNVNNEISINKSEISSCKHGDIIGQKLGILSFFISEDNINKKIWPTTCPHEGARLTLKCIKGDKILCPWHNRIAKPLMVINKENNKIEIISSMDYLVSYEKNSIKIKYKNDPESYNQK